MIFQKTIKNNENTGIKWVNKTQTVVSNIPVELVLGDWATVSLHLLPVSSLVLEKSND